MQAAISLRSLRRDYNERPVLREVSIDLAIGRTLAVIGPNGAGKSTLLRILATLLRPTAGEVEVLGAGPAARGWKVRGRIGYLGHEPLLYRELSVRENLEFNARLHGVERPGERIASLLDATGLAHRAGELVRNLSAGMLQRAAICRALLHEPELLLLDEPRSHLDLGARRDRRRAARPGARAGACSRHPRDRVRARRGRSGAGAARRRLGGPQRRRRLAADDARAIVEGRA